MLAFYLSILTNETDQLNFEKLYRNYGNNVLKYANSRLHNQQNAEDLAHDTWVWVAEHFERFHAMDESSIRNYIMKIVENKCNNVFRKQKLEMSLSDDVIFETAEQEWTDDNEMFLSFCEKEDVQTIVSCMKDLDSRYRDVLNLFYLNESTAKEIAEMLQLKDSTVRQRLARGRRMLIAILQEKGLNNEFKS